ncbi:YdcF family protein [Patescibacteria group bacterium]|nr:YdcF family protein [Patescibacteria group bacterium]MBU1906740.1 YdcF family protein [Patescibacteria group bacterium]
MKTYLILGYGIPADKENDLNYTIYLSQVFNHIFSESANQPALLILCGGPTSCEPPYKGTEAEYIAERLNKMMGREELKKQVTQWKIELEDESLSTLENLVNAKKILDAQIGSDKLTVFCEATRLERIQNVGAEVFGEQKFEVVSIDFDMSKNRYGDPDKIRKKEEWETEDSLWVLEDPERLIRHHQVFEEKLELLRKKQEEGMSHVDAVAEWYINAPDIFKKHLLDSPAVKR